MSSNECAMLDHSKPTAPGVVPTIITNNCKEHIQWIKKVFQAEQYEIYMSEDNGRVLHCVLGLNGGCLYLSDPMEELGGSSSQPQTGPPGFLLSLEMDEPSEVWNRATANEACIVMELAVQECGKLFGCFRDPHGLVWGVGQPSDNAKLGVVPFILHDGDCAEQVQWMVTALNGTVQHKMAKEGQLQYCTVEVNSSSVCVANGSAFPNLKQLASSGKVEHLMCHLDLPDPYPLWEQLLANGASITIKLEKQFWGGTYGAVRDPQGVEWSLSKACTKEDQPNYKGVTPYIRSIDCDKHIGWVQMVFEGEVKELFRTKEKQVMHCRIAFNGGDLYLSDKLCSLSDTTQENSEGVVLHVVLADPDRVWKKALNNKAEVIMELEQQFWGGYYGSFRDPFGIRWGVMKKCDGSHPN